jgi:hypothetical protein
MSFPALCSLVSSQILLITFRRNSIFKIVLNFVQDILLYVYNMTSYGTSKTRPIF